MKEWFDISFELLLGKFRSPIRALMAIIVFWGIPALFMLVYPAYFFATTHSLSTTLMICAATGFLLMLGYTQYVSSFIDRINGDD